MNVNNSQIEKCPDWQSTRQECGNGRSGKFQVQCMNPLDENFQKLFGKYKQDFISSMLEWGIRRINRSGHPSLCRYYRYCLLTPHLLSSFLLTPHLLSHLCLVYTYTQTVPVLAPAYRGPSVLCQGKGSYIDK